MQDLPGRSQHGQAQGGVAAVTNLAVDNFEKHINDTMVAGDYIPTCLP